MYYIIGENMIKRHPFDPVIFKESKKMLVGTLPPEKTDYFYSGSPQTRMWDILRAIINNSSIPKESYKLPMSDKKQILKQLNISMFDIIFEYERTVIDSSKDVDIIPKKYSDINSLIKNTQIDTLLFVYESAAQWFLHSMKNENPCKLKSIKDKTNLSKEIFWEYGLGGKNVRCILLPNPLNRGKKGVTLEKKKVLYEKYIKG